jgi:mitotic-spindle organizing protein 1
MVSGSNGQEEEDQAGKEALDAAVELAELLDTGLDRSAVSAIARLVEQGVNSEALAQVVKEIRRESTRVKARSLNLLSPLSPLRNRYTVIQKGG